MKSLLIAAQLMLVVPSMWRTCLRRQQQQHGAGVLANAWTTGTTTRRSANCWTRSSFVPRGGFYSPPSQSSSSSSAAAATASSQSASASSRAAECADDVDLSVLVNDPSLKYSNFGGIDYLNTQKTDKFRVVFVLGGPGAGKGTQSNLMMENDYPIVHLSAGELLREEVAKPDSKRGELIESFLVAGKIVPVEITLQLLESAMQEAAAQHGSQLIFLVDGFPRNFDNVQGWTSRMTDSTILWSVLFYQCPLKVLEERILERAKESGRSDDNLEALQKRFATFQRETVPVVTALEECANEANAKSKDSQDDDSMFPQWCVSNIAGNQAVDEVWKASKAVLDGLIQHDVLTVNAALLEAIRSNDVESYRSLTTFLDDLEGRSNDDEDDSSDTSSPIEASEGGCIRITDLSNAKVEVIDGRHVTVRYDVAIDGEPQLFRETRQWAHNGSKGWQNVHFTRIPVHVDKK